MALTVRPPNIVEKRINLKCFKIHRILSGISRGLVGEKSSCLMSEDVQRWQLPPAASSQAHPLRMIPALLTSWDDRADLNTRSTLSMRIASTPPLEAAAADHRQLPRREQIHVPSAIRTM